MYKNILKVSSLLLILSMFNSILFAHSGRTDKNGGHYNRTTGVYHYHNSGSGSSSTTDFGQLDDGAILVAGVVILVVVCWAIIDPDSCCLFDTAHNLSPDQRYLNRLPTRLPVNLPLVPRFNFARQEHAGWEFSVSYTFRF